MSFRITAATASPTSTSTATVAAPILVEFGRDGTVLTRTEIFALRRKRGLCPTCGVTKCYRPFVFFRVPITHLSNGALAGVCLHCHPERRVLREFWELVEGKRWAEALEWAREHGEQFDGAGQLCGCVLQTAYKDGASEEFLNCMLDHLLRCEDKRDEQQLRRCFRHACSYGVSLGHLKRVLASVSPSSISQTWEALLMRLESGESEWRYHKKESDAAIALLRRGPEYWAGESKRKDAASWALAAAFPPCVNQDFERWYFSCTDEREEDTTNAILKQFLEAHPCHIRSDTSTSAIAVSARGPPQLPLHRAISAGVGWDKGLAAIYEASSYSNAAMADPGSGLLPFQLAATRGEQMLDECFRLLRNHPEVLAGGGGSADALDVRSLAHSRRLDGTEWGCGGGGRQSSTRRLGRRVAQQFSFKLSRKSIKC